MEVPEAMHSPEVQNSVAPLRTARGLSATDLATAIGVSRQTIYAIESGSYTPNTLVALKLSRYLNVPVEQIFSLEAAEPAPTTHQAELLDPTEALAPGTPVRLCRVDKRLIATPPEPSAWSLPLADATISGHPSKPRHPTRATVSPFAPLDDLDQRLLLAGCDPGIAVLARHLQPQRVGLVTAHRNSTVALELLRQGSIHVAGCHLRDEATGESNLATIARIFRRQDIAVVSLALWQEGLVTAPGNPKNIRAIEDLTRPDITILNREPGAGSRLLLDAGLRRLGIPHAQVCGYDTLAPGHLPAARRVLAGEADCCIATASVARTLGLGFVPLASARYDLVVHRRHLALPQVQVLFGTLTQAAFRRELEGLAGYDTTVAGQRLI